MAVGRCLSSFVFPAFVAIHHAGVELVAIMAEDKAIAEVVAVFAEFLEVDLIIAGKLAQGFGVELLGHFLADEDLLEDARQFTLFAPLLAELHVERGNGALHGVDGGGFRLVDDAFHVIALVGLDLEIAHHHLVELVLRFDHHHFTLFIYRCGEPGGGHFEAHIAHEGEDDGIALAGINGEVSVAITHLSLPGGGVDDVHEGHGRDAVGFGNDAFDEGLSVAAHGQ